MASIFLRPRQSSQTVFEDENSVEFDDELHSYNEERVIVIGYSSKQRILMVVYTERVNDIIRIISARRATKSETDLYFLEKR